MSNRIFYAFCAGNSPAHIFLNACWAISNTKCINIRLLIDNVTSPAEIGRRRPLRGVGGTKWRPTFFDVVVLIRALNVPRRRARWMLQLLIDEDERTKPRSRAMVTGRNAVMRIGIQTKQCHMLITLRHTSNCIFR